MMNEMEKASPATVGGGQAMEKASRAVELLKQLYPEAVCALEWGGQEDKRREAWKLLVMARLSAQCTDARVNMVSRDLFAAFPTPKAMAEADLSAIEAIIRPCGLYHTKAESIKAACDVLVRVYDGFVPDNMEALLALPGVGRKIANLLLGDIYGQPGVVCDTHCIRICGRLGFYDSALKDPARIEKILTPLIQPEEQSAFCHRIVQFGRDVCTARAPRCEGCLLRPICDVGQAGVQS
jgi:endonuclease-3